MKKYIFAMIVGLFFVFMTDYIIGGCLKYFYSKQTSGLLYRTTYSMEKTNADILIFGTSRANHHYNIKMLEESTGISAYNTGRDGNFVFYQTAILKSILNRYTPKQIILDFTGTFAYRQEDYDRLSSLLPYYKTHPEISDIITLKSPYEKYKLFSKIYPYNSLLTTIAVGNMEFNNNRRNNAGAYKGFVPLNETYQGNLDTLNTSDHYEIDKNKYEVFEEFLKLTKEKNIPLLVIYSPVYYLYDKDYSIEICKQICNKNHITFIDFSKDEDFLKNKGLFKDKSHLNNKGAEIFTRKIINTIKTKANILYK